MNYRRFRAWLFMAALALPASALAQVAYTTQNVNVRAGPGRDYPLVAWIVPGTRVAVAGCLADLKWCDVIIGATRGWVYARFLSYPYENRSVVILGSGPTLALPIITFSIGPYWNHYYRNRPWFGDRSRWEHRPPPAVRPPQPRPPAVHRPMPKPPGGARPHAPRPGTVPGTNRPGPG